MSARGDAAIARGAARPVSSLRTRRSNARSSPGMRRRSSPRRRAGRSCTPRWQSRACATRRLGAGPGSSPVRWKPRPASCRATRVSYASRNGWAPYQPAEAPEPAHKTVRSCPAPPSIDPTSAAPLIAAATSWSDLHAATGRARHALRAPWQRRPTSSPATPWSRRARWRGWQAWAPFRSVWARSSPQRGRCPAAKRSRLDSEIPRVDEYRKARDAYLAKRDADWVAMRDPIGRGASRRCATNRSRSARTCSA